MKRTRWTHVGFFIASLAVVACGSAGSGQGGVGAAGGAAASTGFGNAPGAGGDAGTSSGEVGKLGGGQTVACARYVDCVAATSPDEFPETVSTYGPTGTCWSGAPDLAGTCDQACANGLTSANSSWPEKTECALCESSEECTSPATCNPHTHRCVDVAAATFACVEATVKGLGPEDLATCTVQNCPSEYQECFAVDSIICPGFAECLAGCDPDCSGECVNHCIDSQSTSCQNACTYQNPESKLASCAIAHCM